MAYARTFAVGLLGLAGHMVQVEADLANGLPGLALTGLPDAALHEARDRVRAALVNSGESWPNRRITVNLLPAALPKHGSVFDVAIATALLIGSGAVPAEPLADAVLLGELGLDGAVRPVRGILPSVLAARRAGIRRVVVPAANAAEARLVPGVGVLAAGSLAQIIDHGRTGRPLPHPAPPGPAAPVPGPDLADVAGQELGKRALELAAAGAHHVLLIGPPGAGKSMLAERLPSVLPPLDDAAALEVTALHSIAGLLPTGSAMIRRPPLQAPHHSASIPALVGGGSGMARPGALSLAHHGVLVLDEAPEFGAGVLEALRQPLETGEVVLRRVRAQTVYPARFQLVLAANPCPCAKPAGDRYCECSPLTRRRYLGRLSGPLLDRVDLQVRLDPVSSAHLCRDDGGEPSSTVAARVAGARAAAAARWAAHGWRTNAEVPGHVLRRAPYRLNHSATAGLRARLDAGSLSARGHDRVLRLAWTVADLDGHSAPDRAAIEEALALRTGWDQ